MTQTQIEQTRVIAEWDGLKLHTPSNKKYAPYWLKYDSDGLVIAEIPCDKLPYLTSLDWLHPVAMNVLDELTKLFNDTMDGDVFMPVSDLEYNIKRSCYIRPISGEYIDLFNAVYEGIVYLQNQEK